MELRSLQDLFVMELKDLYSAERQILDALPKMADAASHEELKGALNEHVEVTKEQVQRLEQIFDGLGESPTGHKCKGVEGIIREGQDLLSQGGDKDTLDAGIIGAEQKVEHYEISGYGTARTFAQRLGMTDAANLLQKSLEEESSTDERLTGLAERVVNPDAESGGEMRAA